MSIDEDKVGMNENKMSQRMVTLHLNESVILTLCVMGNGNQQ